MGGGRRPLGLRTDLGKLQAQGDEELPSGGAAQIDGRKRRPEAGPVAEHRLDDQGEAVGLLADEAEGDAVDRPRLHTRADELADHAVGHTTEAEQGAAVGDVDLGGPARPLHREALDPEAAVGIPEPFARTREQVAAALDMAGDAQGDQAAVGLRPGDRRDRGGRDRRRLDRLGRRERRRRLGRGSAFAVEPVDLKGDGLRAVRTLAEGGEQQRRVALG